MSSDVCSAAITSANRMNPRCRRPEPVLVRRPRVRYDGPRIPATVMTTTATWIRAASIRYAARPSATDAVYAHTPTPAKSIVIELQSSTERVKSRLGTHRPMTTTRPTICGAAMAFMTLTNSR
jgi:hypothetical protein